MLSSLIADFLFSGVLFSAFFGEVLGAFWGLSDVDGLVTEVLLAF